MLDDINISVSIAAIIICLYIGAVNLINRFRYIENRILIAICFAGAIQFSFLLYLLIFHDSPHLTLVARLYYSTILIQCALLLPLVQVIIKWRRRPPGMINILTVIPGVVLAAATILTDMVIAQVYYKHVIIWEFGKLITVYYAVQMLYFVGTFIYLIYKMTDEENESFKKQLKAYLGGVSLFGTIFSITFIGLPYYLETHEFTPIGTASFWIVLFIVINYSISDVLILNYKKLYLRGILWLAIFFALLVPSYFIFRNNVLESPLGISNLTISNSILIPVVFFNVFWVTYPIAKRIVSRNYRKIENEFNNLYDTIAESTRRVDRTVGWDHPLNMEIELLIEKFSINNAAFYVFFKDEDKFTRTHNINMETSPGTIEKDSEIVLCLNEYKSLIEKSMLFTDETLWPYKEVFLQFFKDTNLVVALPIFDLDHQLSAILFLGPFKSGELYTIEFLTHLKSFSSQFGFTLVRYKTFEIARRIQAVEHDKTVITNIKNKIIPKSFDQVRGIKTCSLYINNSEFGGDYFDTIKLDKGKAGIFIANTLDEGINSSMLALQMYTILHTHAARFDSSDRVLNIMNQVIVTTKYSEKHATAFYLIYSADNNELIYSNAAFNPLLLFNTKENRFSEITSEGIPIGIDGHYIFKRKTMKLEPGSIGILYSDGFTSAINQEGNSYSISRVMDIVNINKHEIPSKLVQIIYKDFQEFIEKTTMVNDVSLIIFKVS